MKQTSLKRYFAKLFLPSIFLFLVVVVGLFTFNDYQINQSSRVSSENLVADTFLSGIRQPLLQGSFIEAKVRAEELLKNKQVKCVEIKVGSQAIIDCSGKSLQIEQLYTVVREIYFSENDKIKYGDVAIYFDNADLVNQLLISISKWTVAFGLLGVILFLSISVGLERISTELGKLLLQAQNESNLDSQPAFRIGEFQRISDGLHENMEKAALAMQARASLEIAQQVAHDIRSPLSVLNTIAYKMKASFPQEGILLGDVSARIIQIADGLLDVSRKSTPVVPDSAVVLSVIPATIASTQSILKVCEQAVIEKKMEPTAGKVKFQFYSELIGGFDVYCECNELSRIISNLLNNSIEAILDQGFISITLSERIDGLLIEIRDSGKGMSNELIAKVFQGPISEGKARGNGLGLWPAIDQIRGWQGNVQIHSGAGTTVSIFLSKFLKS